MATLRREQIRDEDTWLQFKIRNTKRALLFDRLTANERIVATQTLESYRDQLKILRRQARAK